MTARLLAVLICSFLLVSCDGGAARCAAEGEKAGRLAGEREGRSVGRLIGEREGDELGAMRARIAAAQGDLGEIYVLPFMVLFAGGIALGVGIQIALLRRLRAGVRLNEIWASLIPGFSFSHTAWRHSVLHRGGQSVTVDE